MVGAKPHYESFAYANGFFAKFRTLAGFSELLQVCEIQKLDSKLDFVLTLTNPAISRFVTL